MSKGVNCSSWFSRDLLNRLTTLECSQSLSLELVQVFSHNMPRVMGLTDCDQQLSGTSDFDPL